MFICSTIPKKKNKKKPKLIKLVITFLQVYVDANQEFPITCLGLSKTLLQSLNSQHFEFTGQMNNPTALQNKPTSFTEAANFSGFKKSRGCQCHAY